MEQNPFPEIKLFRPAERLMKIGKFIYDRFYGDVPAVRGASFMLDQALDSQPKPNTWDDMGSYTDRTIPDISGREL